MPETAAQRTSHAIRPLGIHDDFGIGNRSDPGSEDHHHPRTASLTQNTNGAVNEPFALDNRCCLGASKAAASAGCQHQADVVPGLRSVQWAWLSPKCSAMNSKVLLPVIASTIRSRALSTAALRCSRRSLNDR